MTQRRGDRKRWMLIDALRVIGPRPVSIREIALITGISRDVTQHHLQVLESQGAIEIVNKSARRSLPRTYRVLTVAENPDKEQADGDQG